MKEVKGERDDWQNVVITNATNQILELRKETNGLYGLEKGDDQDEGSAPSNPDIPRIKEMIKSSIIPKIVVVQRFLKKQSKGQTT